MPNTTNAWLLHNEKRKKGIRNDRGRRPGYGFFSVPPPPSFKYCSDMLLCGLLGNKRKSVGVSWVGGG